MVGVMEEGARVRVRAVVRAREEVKVKVKGLVD